MYSDLEVILVYLVSLFVYYTFSPDVFLSQGCGSKCSITASLLMETSLNIFFSLSIGYWLFKRTDAPAFS